MFWIKNKKKRGMSSWFSRRVCVERFGSITPGLEVFVYSIKCADHSVQCSRTVKCEEHIILDRTNSVPDVLPLAPSACNTFMRSLKIMHL